MLLYRHSPGSQFAYTIRENAPIRLQDGSIVKRNVYSHYVSNSNPVYARINGHIVYLSCENYNTDTEIFKVSLIGRKYK